MTIYTHNTTANNNNNTVHNNNTYSSNNHHNNHHNVLFQAGFTLGNVVGMYLAQNYDVSSNNIL